MANLLVHTVLPTIVTTAGNRSGAYKADFNSSVNLNGVVFKQHQALFLNGAHCTTGNTAGQLPLLSS